MTRVDQELHRALWAAWRTRRRGYWLAGAYRHEVATIVVGRPRRGWGHSTHRTAYLSHIPVEVFVAWRRGRVVGSMVVWRCGASTAVFRLVDEPVGQRCPVCLIERASRWSR